MLEEVDLVRAGPEAERDAQRLKRLRGGRLGIAICGLSIFVLVVFFLVAIVTVILAGLVALGKCVFVTDVKGLVGVERDVLDVAEALEAL